MIAVEMWRRREREKKDERKRIQQAEASRYNGARQRMVVNGDRGRMREILVVILSKNERSNPYSASIERRCYCGGRCYVRASLRPDLFPVGGAEDVALDGSAADTATLRWYDPTGDADVTLRGDRATATPQGWRQVLRASGQVVTVSYDRLDGPVDIPPAP